MVKSRKKKNTRKPNNTKKPKKGRGRPKELPDQESPDALKISPFKGFDNAEISGPSSTKHIVQLFKDDDKEVAIIEDEKNKIFDKLLDSDNKNKFLNKNIKTYSNKMKKPVSVNPILEFQDCKNRDHIVKWLNDNRNVFDRLTQTQGNFVDENDDVLLTLDMPSVSQVNTTRLNQSSKRVRKICRSPYRLRARSLDVHVKKNCDSGRSMRHSLAGDTPTMENYHIEEAITDIEDPIPAGENAKILVDLIEDEYLIALEKEMQQREEKDSEKKNLSDSGWDRINDVKKTINGNKKQPKKLKITLQSTSNKKESENLFNINNLPVYPLNVLENYFVENMEKVLNGKGTNDYCSEQEKSQYQTGASVEDAIDIGKALIDILKKLTTKEDLTELQPFLQELEQYLRIFHRKEICEVATQTIIKESFDKTIQTEEKKISIEVQTEDNINCPTCANPTPRTTPSEIFNVQCSSNAIKNHQQVTTASTTPSDLLVWDEMEKMMTDKEKCDLNETFDNACFNTEDILKGEITKRSQRNEIVQEEIVLKTVESVVVCSGPSKNEVEDGKGVKRSRSQSPLDSKKFPMKRPCTKFIKDDLSIGFESETQGPKRAEQMDFQLSEGSDVNYNEYLAQVLKKFERDQESEVAAEPTPKVSRTQQEIEEYDDVIRNITKPKPANVKNENREQPQKEIFSNDSDVILLDSENLSKLEKDLDYFEAQMAVADVETTPKKSRRSLFKHSDANKCHASNEFSQSMFVSDHDKTVIASKNCGKTAGAVVERGTVDLTLKTINQDTNLSDREADNEVQLILAQEVPKINILQNIVLKVPGNNSVKIDDNGSENSDDVSFSDVDVVESTPQKKYPNSSEQRCEALLDITLPPPLEFQDTEERDKDVTLIPSTPRRPLAVVNKITSTPISQQQASEKLISLSPISLLENNRILGPIELARRSKFSPLTIVRKAQCSRISGTPKQKSILNYVRSSQESQESQKSQKGKPCIACTRISREQMMGISTMTNRKLVTYSTSFSSKVTHMIVCVDEKNCIKDHTMKFVSAVAAGIWVLSYEWVRECLGKNCIVSEEPFEALDVSGIPGPRESRLSRSSNPLFRGYKIHAAPPFLSATPKDVENVVEMLGGKIAASPEDLLEKGGYNCIIITEAKATQHFDVMYETWLEALRVVTVDIEWLSRSVGRYKLLSLRPFALCPEEPMDDLGYPPELLLKVPYSFYQS